MPNIPVSDCCGCTACFNACPKAAIQMLPDKEGFLYPRVDEKLCIACGKCEKVCPQNDPPAINKEFAECVVARNADDSVLERSTSGGFIDALYKYVLSEQNGYAVGVAFDNDFSPYHLITDSYEKAQEFRNSKYAQSNLSDIFSKTEELLKEAKTVIFVGTPCQVAGLKSFLVKDYSNLITVDLVCRSIPSPMLWKKYLEWQEKKHRSKVAAVSFRKKTYGYHSGTLEMRFQNRKRYNGSNRVDYYMKAFHSDICSRPSCYNCSFKGKNRCSDFTVFDSWNPQAVAVAELRDDDRGFSNVIAHTKKAGYILENMKDIRLFKADFDKIFDFAGGMESTSIKHKPERETFYDDINTMGFHKGIKKYVKVSVKDRIIEAAKPLFYFLKKQIGR